MYKQPFYYQLGENFKRIGATCHFIELDGKNIVIDYGTAQTRNGEGKKIRHLPHGENFISQKRIDLVFCSHAHDDHIGAMPRVVSHHPEADVIISRPVFKEASPIFDEGLNIMRRDGDFIFNSTDVFKFFNNPRLRVVEEGETGRLENMGDRWEGWKIGVNPSGHFIGALSLFLISPTGKRVMITGDISSHDQKSVKGVMVPENRFFQEFINGEVTLITEGTNAARTRKKTRKQIEKELKDFIESVSGPILFPTFGRQRAAELILTLVDLGYNVHIDGIAKILAAIEAPALAQLKEEGKVIPFSGRRLTAERHRRIACDGRKRCCGQESPIIVAPSASLENGHSVGHAERILPDSNNGIAAVGHVFKDTPAYDIFCKRRRSIPLKKIQGDSEKIIEVNVNCKVGLFDLTAHDYQESLLERIVIIEPYRVIVHHAPGFDDYLVFQEKVLRLPKPPKQIFYAPIVPKIAL